MVTPYKVLATYKPSVWKAWKIGRFITDLTRKMGLTPLPNSDTRYQKAPWSSQSLHAHVRKRTLKTQDAEGWHRDGDYGHVPMDHALVLWASTQPTEFRWEGKVYQPKPFEVILVKNITHRRPPNVPRERWIFRQRVQVPEWL